MKESEEKKVQNPINKVLQEAPKRRTALFTPTERTVVFGILYAILASGFTLVMDLLPVPEKESTLWILMACVYLAFLAISILLERLYRRRKLEIHRTIYYCVAQLLLLIAIIVLIVLGVNTDVALEYNSYFSYALAFGFTEIVILLYHLVRFVVLCIVKNKK